MTGDENKQSVNRRTLRGLLVKPQDQVKYMFIFVGGVLLSLAAMIGLLVAQLMRAISFLEETQRLDLESARVLRETLTASMYVICGVACVVSIFSLFMGLRLSHRIYGPMVPIQRLVEQLIRGDRGARVKLRKHDEFVELADSLNRLAEKLDTAK